MNVIETFLGIDPELQKKLIASLMGLLVAVSFRWCALRILNRRIKDPRISYGWRKWVSYITYGIAIFALGRPWIPELQDISTFLGIVTAGLAVALKEPLVD